MRLRAGTRLRPMAERVRGMTAAAAWTPGRLPGTPREWLAGPDWCFTDGSAAFTAASSQSLSVANSSLTGWPVGGANSWTLASWVRPTAAVTQGFWDKDANAGGVRCGLLDGRPTLVVYDGTNYVGPATWGTNLSTSNFSFVVCRYDAITKLLSINVNNSGSPLTTTLSANPSTNTLPFVLGHGPGGAFGYLNGNIAATAVFNTALDATALSRLYAGGNGIVYADTTSAERTAWGLVSWWDLVRSGNFTDSHGSNNLTNNNGVSFGAGLPRARAGDTDPIAAWRDRWQGTLVTQSDPLQRPTLRLVSGKWVVRFDGVNDVLTAGDNDFITGAALTAFSRFSSSSIPRYASIVSKQYNFNGYALAGDWTTFGTGKISFNAKSAAYAVSDSSLATGLPTTTIGVNDGTTSRLFVGDTLQSVTAAAGGTMPNTSDEVCIGGGGNAGVYGQFWTGDIASVGLNPADLTAGDRALLAAYLAGVM